MMNPEIETASPAAGSNGIDGIAVTITHASDTLSKSSTIKGGQGRDQGGHTRRGGY